MDSAAAIDNVGHSRKYRNWWKIAFFVAVILFEFMRELLVMEADEPVKTYASSSVFSYNGFVSAQGRWWRSDGGSEIVPGTVTIECSAEREECLEVSASTISGGLSPPTIDRFAASFSPDAVTYENTNPICARYSVRIDLKLETAFATRVKNADTRNPLCDNMEPRIEMKLGDGYKYVSDPTKGHVVPLLAILIGVMRMFDNE